MRWVGGLVGWTRWRKRAWNQRTQGILWTARNTVRLLFFRNSQELPLCLANLNCALNFQCRKKKLINCSIPSRLSWVLAPEKSRRKNNSNNKNNNRLQDRDAPLHIATDRGEELSACLPEGGSLRERKSQKWGCGWVGGKREKVVKVAAVW